MSATPMECLSFLAAMSKHLRETYDEAYGHMAVAHRIGAILRRYEAAPAMTEQRKIDRDLQRDIDLIILDENDLVRRPNMSVIRRLITPPSYHYHRLGKADDARFWITYDEAREPLHQLEMNLDWLVPDRQDYDHETFQSIKRELKEWRSGYQFFKTGDDQFTYDPGNEKIVGSDYAFYPHLRPTRSDNVYARVIRLIGKACVLMDKLGWMPEAFYHDARMARVDNPRDYVPVRYARPLQRGGQRVGSLHCDKPSRWERQQRLYAKMIRRMPALFERRSLVPILPDLGIFVQEPRKSIADAV